MHETFNKIAEQQGWSPDSQVAILLEYIENQQSNDAFEDFLNQKAAAENDHS